MNEIIIALFSFFGGSAAILALIEIFKRKQDTANTVTLTSELELSKVRAELRERVAALEKDLRKSQEHYDIEICKLRSEITLWQAKYWQLQGVADQQRDIIEKLQSQVDGMEANSAKNKAA